MQNIEIGAVVKINLKFILKVESLPKNNLYRRLYDRGYINTDTIYEIRKITKDIGGDFLHLVSIVIPNKKTNRMMVAGVQNSYNIIVPSEEVIFLQC